MGFAKTTEVARGDFEEGIDTVSVSVEQWFTARPTPSGEGQPHCDTDLCTFVHGAPSSVPRARSWTRLHGWRVVCDFA